MCVCVCVQGQQGQQGVRMCVRVGVRVSVGSRVHHVRECTCVRGCDCECVRLEKH